MVDQPDRLFTGNGGGGSGDALHAMKGGRKGGRRGRNGAIEVNLQSLFDRLPPNAIEAEMHLLGAMIIDHRVIGDVIEIVRHRDDFFKAAHGAIYQALVDLYNERNAGDITLLYQRLVDRGQIAEVGGEEYLETLAESTPIVENAVQHAVEVSNKAALRRLIAAAGEVLFHAYNSPEDPKQVLDAAERAIFQVVERSESRQAEALADLLIETMAAIESRSQSGTITGLSTGYRAFDEQTSGLQPGDMIILAARPSMGKTAFAINIAENAALMGNGVLVFSMEMSKQQLAQRLLCSRSEVDSQRLRRNMIGKDDLRRLGQAVGELSEAPIFIDDTPGLSVLEMRAKARRMFAQHQIKLIVIDYLQLMSGSTKESRQTEVAEISRGVKGIARELSVPVICLSQLNRAAENREDHRPRLSDLRESGSIEQDADIVMMLHREDYYRQKDDDFVPTNIAEVIIAKQRNGPTGTVKLTWVGSSMKFKDFAGDIVPGGYEGGGYGGAGGGGGGWGGSDFGPGGGYVASDGWGGADGGAGAVPWGNPSPPGASPARGWGGAESRPGHDSGGFAAGSTPFDAPFDAPASGGPRSAASSAFFGDRDRPGGGRASASGSGGGSAPDGFSDSDWSDWGPPSTDDDIGEPGERDSSSDDENPA